MHDLVRMSVYHKGHFMIFSLYICFLKIVHLEINGNHQSEFRAFN